MIKLLKSIIQYHKVSLLIAITFILIINFALLISGDWQKVQFDFPGMRVIWFLPISLIYIVVITRFNLDKRNRLYNLLPQSINNTALTKLLVAPVMWFLIVLINFCLYPLLNSGLPSSTWFYDNISYTGIILLFSSVPLVYADLTTIAIKPFSKFLMGTAWTIIMLSIMSYFLLSLPYLSHVSPQFISNTGSQLKFFYFSAKGSIILIMTGTLTSAISIYVYKKRRSYLE